VNIEKQIQEIHKQRVETFGESVAVKIFVNSEGIEVETKYSTDRAYSIMQMINGEWVKKKNKF
jgi:hypothetical protein